MKSILAMSIIASTLLAGCTSVIMTDVIDTRPVVITETYHISSQLVTYAPTPYCYWVDTPVYGYADVYRDGYTHVRIKEVAYTNQQWRCN